MLYTVCQIIHIENGLWHDCILIVNEMLMYLLDVLQSQRSCLSEDLDSDAVTRVLQDQTANVKPPGDNTNIQHSLLLYSWIHVYTVYHHKQVKLELPDPVPNARNPHLKSH